ncbi:putative xanthine dehydrogenase molybdenum-binding subunit XdhA [wastewater metagenome]|uniref:Putative xanthine dehydrogenase molybdenum-binding subunit XdhA n=2 Tax=unclassified sequences TaxID=12908 RepID=A0A5B8R5R7_9ZZZZ|nr:MULTISPECIES: xanthine dehydrogenase molybdopterin binding subunit [Arhodomonas]QEA03866.1 putative xanthine dehydrogenase molybdenum-binding subunit XdhA [uncultured organism]
MSETDTRRGNPGVNVARPHDSAHKHVSGSARYVDDLPEPRELLHAYARLAERAHARINRLDVSAVDGGGVAAVVTPEGLGTTNDIGPVFPGDQVFADGEVLFYGQPLFAVAAGSIDAARRAAMRAEVDYEDLPAILDVDAALDADADLLAPKRWRRGEPEAAIEAAPHHLEGRTYVGGQEHFYLEGQVAMAVPQEDGDMLVYSSTQHPSEVQHLVAKVLGLPDHAVTVETRRMGGAFGGKETQGAQIAVIAALLAQRTGRPVKYRLDRDDDMTMTGKRHDLRIDYRVGFDDDGRIRGITFMQAVRCGYAPDLSHSVSDRAMYHADNAYFLENVEITSRRLRTNTVSNTAFRGFGGPQGMVGMEHVIEEIARELGLDPLAVRRRNLYGVDERNITPYGMTVEDNILPELLGELETSSEYARRREAVRAYNAASPWLKKGIAVTPVKFGISFTAKHLNQAGALVLVYQDGSVQLNHGGTEMGQGLHIKVAQVVAEVFGIDLERVRITATHTGKVPNTSPTAASSGSDLNGAAAYNAATKIVDRLLPVIRDHFDVSTDAAITFRDNAVYAGGRELASFAEVVRLAYFRRVQLSAAGFYATPKLQINEDGTGRPFYYFAYGAACSEVVVDTLTGEYRVTRVDILHDVGRSLNPAIDMGQIEGGFIQGMGWLTTEELWWDEHGRLMTHAPSTYKIPACSDLPADFRARIYERGENVEEALYRSKAVGEPPLMLAISVLHALKDAVASAADYRVAAPLHAPATPEAVLMAVQAVRGTVGAGVAAAQPEVAG